MYKNLAMLWTLNCILFDEKNKNKMIISLIDNEKGELLKLVHVLARRVPCKLWIKYYLAKMK
jgi:hypothetical protein